MWWNNCIPLSITQFFLCLWHRNSMWQRTSSSSQHFHQCCFQVLNVRHRVWWYIVFRKWLTDVSGRCRQSSILVRLGKMVSLCPIHCSSGYLEKIASSYCIYFFLEKKKQKNLLFRLLSKFTTCPVKEYYLPPPPISVLSLKRQSSSAATLHIFNICDYVWGQWGFKLSLSL